VWSVSQVNTAARRLLEGAVPPLWVAGEVTNFTRARSGHCYFTLRDREAQIRCVMWRDEARRLPTAPEEGMEVRALGRLTLYVGRGDFQLAVAALEGRGEGLWKLAFDRLRARLQAEGLLAPERKRRLPLHPACVGVVTSLEGAAVRDILSVIRRRAPWTRVVVCGCRVQGDGAAAEIAAAIRRFGNAPADLLIIGRGGGSREDLWAFNEEIVARAIAASAIPTISAVGHETDLTIADLIADLRVPTPSAAAEAAVPDGEQLLRELSAVGDRLVAAWRGRAAAAGRVGAARAAALRSAAARDLIARRERLGSAAHRLNALSPLAALARGYAVPLDGDGHVMRTIGDFAAGDAFRLRVADGVVPCRVEDTPEPL
jgi:exodeoxyribonuclease VII large subunit